MLLHLSGEGEERLGCQTQLERNQSQPSHAWEWGAGGSSDLLKPCILWGSEGGRQGGGWARDKRVQLRGKAREEEEERQDQRSWHRERGQARKKRGARRGAEDNREVGRGRSQAEPCRKRA